MRNVLLESANTIFKKHRFSDTSYNELETLFKNADSKAFKNAKAILKKDLALVTVLSDILALLAIVLSVGVVGSEIFNQLYVGVIVLFYIILYVFGLIPALKKENYVLSIMEDI